MLIDIASIMSNTFCPFNTFACILGAKVEAWLYAQLAIPAIVTNVSAPPIKLLVLTSKPIPLATSLTLTKLVLCNSATVLVVPVVSKDCAINELANDTPVLCRNSVPTS